MRCTGAAGPLQLRSECGSCSMKTDACVAGCQPVLIGEGADGFVAEVNAADQFGVLGLEIGDEVVHACADGAFQVCINNRIARRRLMNVRRDRSLSGRFVSVVICDRVPQQPVKPGYSAFLVSNLCCTLHAADEGVLKDLFRILAAADSGGEEVKETAVVRQQSADDSIRMRLRIVCCHLNTRKAFGRTVS